VSEGKLRSVIGEIPRLVETKKGKLPTSHRYDHLPLLRSRPGGFSRSWLCRTCQLQRYNLLLLLQWFY